MFMHNEDVVGAAFQQHFDYKSIWLMEKRELRDEIWLPNNGWPSSKTRETMNLRHRIPEIQQKEEFLLISEVYIE